ncbi:MAG: hypothetical protein V1649_00750 [Patescibacteria group bacterium]
MISSIYSKIPQRIRLLILFVFIILIAYFVLRFFAAEPRTIPEDFLRARQEASVIAATIVAISNESTNNFEKIAALDSEGNYTDALILVSQELERNRQAREKAINLSIQLETMAKNLDKITPSSAGQTALEAISSETALISRLINYNDFLTQILDILREKFLGRADGDKIPELIAKANNEAQAINDLNQKFNDIMKGFDLK